MSFQGPYRHYVLNFLWILINLLCLALTMYHLHKLYQDFTSSDLEAVRMMSLFTSIPNLQCQVRKLYRIVPQIITCRRECLQAM